MLFCAVMSSRAVPLRWSVGSGLSPNASNSRCSTKEDNAAHAARCIQVCITVNGHMQPLSEAISTVYDGWVQSNTTIYREGFA